MKTRVVIFLGLALAACQKPDASSEKTAPGKPSVELLDLTWTPEAANRADKIASKDPMQYSLPEVRVYDAKQQLIFHKNGLGPDDVPRRNRYRDRRLQRQSEISRERKVSPPQAWSRLATS